MSLQRTQEKKPIETQKKKNTTTRDKSMTILIGLLRFGKINNNTIIFFYLRYLNKNLIILRGWIYLWLIML